jgi:superfamily I DNA/RNA helicase
LWEGHTRPALEKLAKALGASAGDRAALAAAIVRFLGDVGVGFTPSAFGNDFERETREFCIAKRSGKRATIQDLARFLIAEPDHRGVAKVLRRLAELKEMDERFSGIETDCRKEFWEAVRLGDFDSPDAGLAEITNRRTYSRPKPPEKAISIIHKAKGLECESVIVMPCDAKTFGDNPAARCLLYVALSRAKSRLMLVVSRDNPSALFRI